MSESGQARSFTRCSFLWTKLAIPSKRMKCISFSQGIHGGVSRIGNLLDRCPMDFDMPAIQTHIGFQSRNCGAWSSEPDTKKNLDAPWRPSSPREVVALWSSTD